MKRPSSQIHSSGRKQHYLIAAMTVFINQIRDSRSKEAQFNNAKHRVRKPGSNQSLLTSAAAGKRHTRSFRSAVSKAPSLSLVFLIALSGLLSGTAGLAASAEKNRRSEKTNSPASPSSSEYEAFKLIIDRNIFNPNRRPGVPDEVTKVEAPKPVKIEAFSLVGTMIDDERGALAFFDGTEPKYQVVLKPDGTIGGYRISNIALSSVKLEANSNEVELPFGMQMRKPGEAEWQLVIGSAVSEASSRDSSSGFRSRDSGGGGRDSGNRGRDFGNRGRDSGNSSRDFGNRNRSPGTSRDFRSPSAVTVAPPETDSASKTGEKPISDAAADDVLKKLMEKRQQELK
jgi:hypothetical protein